MGIGEAAAAVPKRPNQIFLLFLFLFWFILALTQSLNHEIWRDEVTPLSYATQSESIWELMRNPPRDGHPLAWPILLHLAYKVFHTNAILPVLNFSLTAAAVLVFLLRAPFGWPILVLFTFSAMTLNEYPVINRNYSISMLLMIIFAAVYSGEKRSALLLAGVLFVLANTNVHSALLSLAFLFSWCCDWFVGRREHQQMESGAAMLAAAAIVLLGILLSFVSVYPPADDAWLSEKSLADLLTAIVLPGRFFTESFEPLTVILGYKLTWAVGTALLGAVVAGLGTDPTLAIAAAGATWGFSLLFALIYGGLYRHQALLIVFFVCLYWVALTRRAQGRPGGKEAFKLGLGIALPLLLLTQDISAANRAVKEITLPYSSSKSLSVLLNNTPELKNAIVMGSPEYLVEALPYYVPNDLYLTRENRFGRVSLYSKKFATQMRLSTLLDLAQRLRAEYRRPIVILVGSELNEDFPETTLSEGGGRTFHYTQEEAREFKAAVEKLASLRGTIEVSEGYDVYILR